MRSQYDQHTYAEWARLLQNITCVTDQPFRGGSDGSTQGVTVGTKVFGPQDIRTQVEPEVIRQEVQQEGELDRWQRDAPAQARQAQDTRRTQGDEPQTGNRNRNQRGERKWREDSAQAHVKDVVPQIVLAQVDFTEVGGADQQQKEIHGPQIFRSQIFRPDVHRQEVIRPEIVAVGRGFIRAWPTSGRSNADERGAMARR